MRIRYFLYCLLALPAAVFADANDGQFMGYELGTVYATPSEKPELMTTGNLLQTAENPTKPDDIWQVSLITTPETQNIGYIVAASWFPTEREARDFAIRYVNLLRAKYSDWAFGQEKMDDNFDIVEVSLDMAPHQLKVGVTNDNLDGRNMWRASLGLGWERGSDEWLAWENLARSEHAAAKKSDHEQLINDSDMRGL